MTKGEIATKLKAREDGLIRHGDKRERKQDGLAAIYRLKFLHEKAGLVAPA